MPVTNNENGLSDKQKLFCDYYVIDCNATQAAIKAGYSQETAGVIGCENLKKPNIRAYIDSCIDEKVLSAAETVKLTSDIAKSSVNDYMKIVQVERRRRIKKPLQQKINELKYEIKRKQEVADRIGYNEKRMDALFEWSESVREEIVGYEFDLENNPDAFIIELSDPELEESVELDMVKLAKDKEHGRVKSLQWGEFGPKVELYGADAALTNMLKIHGKFEKDNNQKQPVIKVGFVNTDDDAD